MSRQNSFVTLIEKSKDGLLSNFWLLNSFGWLVYAIIFLPFAITFYGSDSTKVILALFNIFFGFIVTSVLRYIYKNIKIHHRSFINTVVSIFIISFLATMIWYRLDDLMRILFVGWEKGFKNDSFISMIYEVIWATPILLVWSILYFSANIFNELIIQKETSERANALAKDAQLEMLRYQLNPHFIFNTLSSLRALVQKDQSKAKDMITKLSEFLRYSLVDNSSNEVPLSSEIEVIKSYLDIEKVRFGDDLEVKFDIENLAEDYPVPSFLLNPLLDNAIKYGYNSNTSKLYIEINAKVTTDKSLNINVINNGGLRKDIRNDKDGTKTGLNNVKKRLQFIYPNSSTFSLIEKDGFVIATIIIKKQINQNAKTD
ncbi:MAG: histidine kinase [Bacteroidetes bacterium]|nr:histidine kinase [Bacteroidota bacterium]MBU1113706.1 histidine kinase [Bacteroidota bacterium]MBU1798061.1 histidine kinase [Bacteroidota bacterium]